MTVRLPDAEIRDRIALAVSAIAREPTRGDPLLLTLVQLRDAVAAALRDGDAFEGVRPTDRELQSGTASHRSMELHDRAVCSDWRVRYLIGLEDAPRPGMVAGDRVEQALRLVGATATPPADWQDRVRAKVAAGLFPPPRPRAPWWRRWLGGGR